MNPAPDPRGDRIATIFFADLLGFEALATQRGADEAFAIVTRCLRRLDEIARRHGGAVDKYLGDCLMAVFGFPVASARAEEEAVAAAEEMLRAVEDTRRELDLGDAFSVRIGANGADTSERDAAKVCDDGKDNDGDYGSDVGGDPGCGTSPNSQLENPACNDGLDNEGDGKVDYDGFGGFYEPDPNCGTPNKNKETANSCGLGFELMLLLPIALRFGTLRRRRRM